MGGSGDASRRVWRAGIGLSAVSRRVYTCSVLVIVQDPTLLATIQRLRVDAWLADGIAVPVTSDGRWTDEHDEHAVHWAIVENGLVKAAARMCIHDRVEDVPEPGYFRDLVLKGPIASLSRLVTRPDARGRSFASRLDDARIHRAQSSGCRHVVVATHLPHRADALQRRGFAQYEAAMKVAHLPRPRVFVLGLATPDTELT
jgi:GNAT superfamily N-acetyltransferase